MTPATPKMKKLRIAVVINDKGDWCASGGGTPKSEMQSCFGFLECCDTSSSASYWVEIEVPLPAGPSTIAATARKVGK